MKKILIIGRGKTGLSVEKWATKHSIESCFFEDDKHLPESYFPILKECDALILSPSVKDDHPLLIYANSLNLKTYSDIDLFLTEIKGIPCIAITGTNGKSTTTALIGYILQNVYEKIYIGGNIGTPVLDIIDIKATAYVLELSSYQLQHSGLLKHNIAVLLNITPDHLDHHSSMDKYVNAKLRIFKDSKNAVICIDDVYTKTIYEGIKDNQNTISVSTKNKADFWLKDEKYFMYKETVLMENENLFLKGEHNIQNILCAFAVCHLMNVSFDIIKKHIMTFKGLSHRLEYVKLIDDILFINDSKATNADATEKALLAYKDYDIYWILGGVSKSEGITPLIPYFSSIKKAYLIGNAAPDFFNVLSNNNVTSSIQETLEKAIHEAFKDANEKGSNKPKVVLLSPACASFDQFKNFEHRGNVFCKVVLEL